jgi:hypothetical protein
MSSVIHIEGAVVLQEDASATSTMREQALRLA